MKKGNLPTLSAVLLMCLVFLVSVEARKTYMIKEQINDGTLKVKSPRVMVSDVKWCFLKDDNNEYCIEGDTNMKFEFKTDQEFKIDASTVAPHFNYTLTFQLTQSSTWFSKFLMKKLISNQVTANMLEHRYGVKFQFYYWYSYQAVCLNFAFYTSPVQFTLLSTTKLA